MEVTVNEFVYANGDLEPKPRPPTKALESRLSLEKYVV